MKAYPKYICSRGLGHELSHMILYRLAMIKFGDHSALGIFPRKNDVTRKRNGRGWGKTGAVFWWGLARKYASP